jgi:hypothetical protein
VIRPKPKPLKPQILKAFKIRHKETGKFKLGGLAPKWGFPGKCWSRLDHVLSHLRLLRETPWTGWEVVEYDLVLRGVLGVGPVTLPDGSQATFEPGGGSG